MPELAPEVVQKASVCRYDSEGAQRHLERLPVALPHDARHLDHPLHARHALHDVLVPCLQAIPAQCEGPHVAVISLQVGPLMSWMFHEV